MPIYQPTPREFSAHFESEKLKNLDTKLTTEAIHRSPGARYLFPPHVDKEDPKALKGKSQILLEFFRNSWMALSLTHWAHSLNETLSHP